MYTKDSNSGRCRGYGSGYNNYDDDNYGNNDYYGSGGGYYDRDLRCYDLYRRGYTLDSRISTQIGADSVEDCARECTRRREGSSSSYCTAFAFQIGRGGSSSTRYNRDCLIGDSGSSGSSGSRFEDNIIRDEDYEVYEYRSDSRNCRENSYFSKFKVNFIV